MDKWALITGASSGIGRALSLRFAKEGWNVVLVARDATSLENLSDTMTKNYHIKSIVICKDLSSQNAAQQIFHQLSEIQIHVFINNAGSGACGLFQDIPSDKDMQMIDLNIRAVTSLTKLAIHHMRQNGGGKILNVASTGAYQPGPYTAVYYATKAYVLSLTQALHNELKGSGILISALCPGSTSTAFSCRAGKADIKGAMSPEKVADCTYKGLIKNKAIIIPGYQNKILIAGSKLFPSRLNAFIVARIQRKLTESYKCG